MREREKSRNDGLGKGGNERKGVDLFFLLRKMLGIFS